MAVSCALYWIFVVFQWSWAAPLQWFPWYQSWKWCDSETLWKWNKKMFGKKSSFVAPDFYLPVCVVEMFAALRETSKMHSPNVPAVRQKMEGKLHLSAAASCWLSPDLSFQPLCCWALSRVKNADQIYFLMCSDRCALWFGPPDAQREQKTFPKHSACVCVVLGVSLRSGEVCSADLGVCLCKSWLPQHLGIHSLLIISCRGNCTQPQARAPSFSSAHATQHFNSLNPFELKVIHPLCRIHRGPCRNDCPFGIPFLSYCLLTGIIF